VESLGILPGIALLLRRKVVTFLVAAVETASTVANQAILPVTALKSAKNVKNAADTVAVDAVAVEVFATTVTRKAISPVTAPRKPVRAITAHVAAPQVCATTVERRDISLVTAPSQKARAGTNALCAVTATTVASPDISPVTALKRLLPRERPLSRYFLRSFASISILHTIFNENPNKTG